MRIEILLFSYVLVVKRNQYHGRCLPRDMKRYLIVGEACRLRIWLMIYAVGFDITNWIKTLQLRFYCFSYFSNSLSNWTHLLYRSYILLQIITLAFISKLTLAKSVVKTIDITISEHLLFKIISYLEFLCEPVKWHYSLLYFLRVNNWFHCVIYHVNHLEEHGL